MKKFRLKRWHWWTGGILTFFLVLFFLRTTILRGAGHILIYEDKLQKAEAMFILSGGAYDRGLEGANVYHEGFCNRLICTGGNESPDFRVVDTAGKTYESDLTRIELLQNHVPDSCITVIRKGTSTLEEADVILDYCKRNHLTHVIVVSSRFHTRRIKKYVKKKLEREGIHVIVHGAIAHDYDENSWWKNEDGLLMVNNEYVKLVYYFLSGK